MPSPDNQPCAVRRLDRAEVARAREDLLALAVRAKGSWGYDAAFLAAFEATMHPSLDNPALTFLVAEVGPAMVGYASLDTTGDPAWLEDLWVEPTWQRRGVGLALLTSVMTEAGRAGARALECESDPNAEVFYLAHGAQRVGLQPSTIDPRRLIPTVRWTLGAVLPSVS